MVNKISKEASSNQSTLITNYRRSLERALLPQRLDDVPVCFIDAQDYRLGTNSQNHQQVENSNFEQFTRTLDRFVQEKGMTGKLATPIQAIKTAIDEVMVDQSGDEKERAYLTVLTRLRKRVENASERISRRWSNTVQSELGRFVQDGYEIASQLGNADMSFSERDFELKVKECYERINSQLEQKTAVIREEENQEIADVVNSEAAAFLFSEAEEEKKSPNKSAPDSENRSSVDRNSINKLAEIVNEASGGMVRLAAGPKAVGGGLFKAGQASGSTLHKAILSTGGKLGVKFKPWQAVNIAKNIGNVAKVVGPIMQVFTIFVDIKTSVDEAKHARQIAQARREFRGAFEKAANDLERQFLIMRAEYLQSFDRIIRRADEVQQQTLAKQKNRSDFMKGLQDCKSQLIMLQDSIGMEVVSNN